MRDAARLLAVEAEVLPGLLMGIETEAFDRPTVCTGWSVRDVLAHCSGAMSDLVADTLGDFGPADNQRAVDERAGWPIDRLLDELFAIYPAAVARIDELAGAMDGMGLGEWIHGGDIREPLGLPGAYASEGSDLALSLISARSAQRGAPALELTVDGEEVAFGLGDPVGRLVTDTETFVRLVSGRRPDPDRFRLTGAASPASLLLFG